VPWPRRLLTCSTGWLTGTRELSKKKNKIEKQIEKKICQNKAKKRFVTKKSISFFKVEVESEAVPRSSLPIK